MASLIRGVCDAEDSLAAADKTSPPIVLGSDPVSGLLFSHFRLTELRSWSLFPVLARQPFRHRRPSHTFGIANRGWPNAWSVTGSTWNSSKSGPARSSKEATSKRGRIAKHVPLDRLLAVGSGGTARFLGADRERPGGQSAQLRKTRGGQQGGNRGAETRFGLPLLEPSRAGARGSRWDLSVTRAVAVAAGHPLRSPIVARPYPLFGSRRTRVARNKRAPSFERIGVGSRVDAVARIGRFHPLGTCGPFPRSGQSVGSGKLYLRNGPAGLW